MNILVASNAFKHSLSATQATQAMARGLARALPSANISQLPIADGGNGTVDAWLALGGTIHTITVHDPLMRPITANYGILPDGKTAVIEMALASGLELLKADELNPLETTTYGTGQLMLHALNHGATRFIIGLGGSATVDAGSGALRALGLRFFNARGAEIPHGGAALSHVAAIDKSRLDLRWRQVEILYASDVQNPLLGTQGAAAIFAPQKGALPEAVQTLEASLTHFAQVIHRQYHVDIRTMAGGGAAGGLAAGLVAFLGGKIQSGIDLLLDYYDFPLRLWDADLVITGEGQMDEQTLQGKGALGIARIAKDYGVPTIALVGAVTVNASRLHEAGLQAVFPILNQPMSLEVALDNADYLLEQAAERLGYVLQIGYNKDKG